MDASCSIQLGCPFFISFDANSSTRFGFDAQLDWICLKCSLLNIQIGQVFDIYCPIFCNSFTPNNRCDVLRTSLNGHGKKLFICSSCGNSFSRHQVLERHVVSIHEGKKPFKCEFCNYSCFAKAILNNHVASVHEGKKPFKCKF